MCVDAWSGSAALARVVVVMSESRVAIRRHHVDAKRAKKYFVASMRLMIKYGGLNPGPPEWLSVMKTLTGLKQF